VETVAKAKAKTKKKASAPKVAKKKPVEKKATPAKKKPVPTTKASKIIKVKREKSTVGQARASSATSQLRPKPVRKMVNLDDVKIPEGYKPSDKEEYMGAKHLLYFRQKLQLWRDELIVESQETLEHLRTETRDVGDEAERASRESDNILELRTRDRYRKLLRKIEEALKRVDDGDYGFCEETGEEIGLGRLGARPIATLTVDAQERREMFQKQFRDDR
jgi:DnaK suppressor protein